MTRRNIRKIPENILQRIRTFSQDDVVVACAKLVQLEDIRLYAHLGVAIVDGRLVTPPPRVPKPVAGRYSKANVMGYDKIRTDLPKISKEFGFWAPDWGNWSNGSHWVSHTREVYERSFYPPKEVELSITLLEERSDAYLIKFAIEQVINRRTTNFEQELLYNLNILQENVGATDVFESAATLAEYAATVKVDWQILPPGTVDEVVRGMLVGKKPVSSEQQVSMKERIAMMAKLKPEAYVAGTDGFLRYFGAKFGDDFVVFENVRYGNAIYVMHEAWQELSRRSRVELLSGTRDSFERIEHREGWEKRLRAMVDGYREARRKASI